MIKNTPYHKLMRAQCTILGFLEEKMDIINFFKWGFNNEIPLLYENAFLHLSSHMFFRSAVVDICALLDDNKYQSFNSYLFINGKRNISKELTNESKNLIEQQLKVASKIIPQIRNLRNEEVSHHRFKEQAINLSHSLLPELNLLYEIAGRIFSIADRGEIGKDENDIYLIGLVDSDNKECWQDYLLSLQRLCKKATKLDYVKDYEEYKTKNDMKFKFLSSNERNELLRKYDIASNNI